MRQELKLLIKYIRYKMSREQNIYNIQLLNDLHNHFPDILYNPSRFRNIQDLLGYIISVANISPYRQGMYMYNQHYNRNTVPLSYNIPTNIPSPVITTRTVPIVLQSVNSTTNDVVRTPLNNQTVINNLISSIFGDILNESLLNGMNIQDFLNERVIVSPTIEQIENASTVYRNINEIEDLCTICQDGYEINQEMRKLIHCNHIFHKECIDTWFRENVHCPTCRHDIRHNSSQNITHNNRQPSTRSSNTYTVPENYRRTNIYQSDES